jgi:hypothetical protein
MEATGRDEVTVGVSFGVLKTWSSIIGRRSFEQWHFESLQNRRRKECALCVRPVGEKVISLSVALAKDGLFTIESHFR